MVTWPRRLMAGLIMAMLAWAVLPGREHSVAHASSEAGADILDRSSLGEAHAEHGSRCGLQAPCSSVILSQQAIAPLIDARSGPTRVALANDVWTHLHRLGHEPPPPRLSA